MISDNCVFTYLCCSPDEPTRHASYLFMNAAEMLDFIVIWEKEHVHICLNANQHTVAELPVDEGGTRPGQ